MYEKLGTREGEKNMYKIAKSRARAQRDVGDVRCVKDENGEVLVRDNEVQDLWRKYFAGLMNEGAESAEHTVEEGDEERGVDLVSIEEVKRALHGMKTGKAVGPDGISVEVWKIAGQKATAWLQRLFNKMLTGEQMPREWRDSWVVPIYKRKGDTQECKNYRGIKLLSHTMKV